MHDTTPEAAQEQLAAFRRQSPAERVALALAASDWLMAVARARLGGGTGMPVSADAREAAARAPRSP